MISPLKITKEEAYWNNFYEEKNAPIKPSSFAFFCISEINKEKSLLEFGCGNGRDSVFFADKKINVIALDKSSVTIMNNKKNENLNLTFLEMDFTKLSDYNFNEDIGTVYSRFTLHSIDKLNYENTIKGAFNQLDENGKFFIEARTEKDPLCGVGTPCPDNGYINTHYRRFLKTKEVIKDLENVGFTVIYAIEDYLSSWYKNDHAVVLRIIAEKRK